jgi:ATP-binding cassette, subfamily F, member 3
VSLIVFENVSLGYGRKQLVEHLDLRIDGRDRVGLVGPNGSGKTSLLRLMAGEVTPDHGDVRLRRQLRVGYLPQDIPVSGGSSVLQTVQGSVPGRAELDAGLEAAEAELEQAKRDGADESRLMEVAEVIADLHEQIDHFERDYSEHEAHRILAGLGFSEADHGRDIAELSGGWKMRTLLAALLFQKPDLLLLDEPTNHLDLPSVAWLGTFLRGYAHAFVLICHDREFLDEQIDRVVSFEPEGVRTFKGNYEQYVRQRAEEEVVLLAQARNLQREREKAEAFITRFRAQANKAKAVQSRIKQLAKMDEVPTFERRRVLRFSFPPCERAGDEVLKIEGLAKSFGDHAVLSGVDLWVRRGERVGIIGVNGAGKTTLLRLIAGELQSDAGAVRLGHKVKVGHFAQHHADALDGRRTVFDEISARNPRASATSVRTLLGTFLFSDEDVDKPIGVLSGGERARVALARMLVDPGNLLLLDEPTNHLDLDSSESLAESLTTYDGTVVFVSHNRSFVRKLATRIWDVADGRVEIYPGSLDDYLDRHRGDSADATTASSGRPVEVRADHATPATQAMPVSAPVVRTRGEKQAKKREEARRRAERAKVVGPLEREAAQVEAKIEALEATQRERNLLLADPALYDDPPRRERVLGEYQRDAAALAELTERWELAQSRLEAALEEL